MVAPPEPPAGDGWCGALVVTTGFYQVDVWSQARATAARRNLPEGDPRRHPGDSPGDGQVARLRRNASAETS
jgi:hypothetical protein